MFFEMLCFSLDFSHNAAGRSCRQSAIQYIRFILFTRRWPMLLQSLACLQISSTHRLAGIHSIISAARTGSPPVSPFRLDEPKHLNTEASGQQSELPPLALG